MKKAKIGIVGLGIMGRGIADNFLKKGERVAKQINAGTVAINTDNFFKPECPFGGYKKSGMGREYGEIGMREFSQVKMIAIVKPFNLIGYFTVRNKKHYLPVGPFVIVRGFGDIS